MKKKKRHHHQQQTVGDKIAQMDDVYAWGYQEGDISKEELINTLNEILLESVPKKIRDYYNWILEDSSMS